MRRATRALTQFYERELAPVGLSATQMTILQALARAGEVTQGRLGEMLAMDSTSLTRTLSIMRREEWVAERRRVYSEFARPCRKNATNPPLAVRRHDR